MQTHADGSRAARRDLAGSPARTVRSAGLGLLAGALGGYVSLAAPMVGVIAAAIGGVLLANNAGEHRLATGGGFLLGAGSMVAWLLSPALTNRDPAVTYSSSTVPVLIAALCAAFAGILLVATAIGRTLRSHHGNSQRA